MQNKFEHRSTQPELIDSDFVPEKLFFKNLRELDIYNRISGGHSISLCGIKTLFTDKDRLYNIVDLGCGSGDTLRYIARWARRHKYHVKLIGVDKKPEAIKYLRNHSLEYPEIKGVQSDYKKILHEFHSFDIVHCSLFCHHLNDKEFTELLNQLKTAKRGFIINDLRRNMFAYQSAKLFTRLLNGSSLSKNDGPVSVLRGFKLKELHKLLRISGIHNYKIYKKRPFRFLIIGDNMSDNEKQ